jgi:hypothetical protein
MAGLTTYKKLSEASSRDNRDGIYSRPVRLGKRTSQCRREAAKAFFNCCSTLFQRDGANDS